MKIEKKLKKLLAESDNLLERHVIDDILEQDEPETYIKDVLHSGCVSGTVSHLIYYKDTKAFFDEFVSEIDELREDMENSLGEPLKIGYPCYNWLAWFGYEEMTRQVSDKLGLNN